MEIEAGKKRHPLTWVPTLYFAEGLPFAIIMIMASIMYQRLGIPTEQLTMWVGILGLAWGLKPLWSPFLEISSSPKLIVVSTQIIGGILLLLTSFTLHLPGFFIFSVSLLCIASYVSATHDIAADGTYISVMDKQQQAVYSGWLGAFWNGGKLFVQGGLVMLAGVLEKSMSASMAWSIVMAVPGVILLVLGFYHMWAMPNKKNHDTVPMDAKAIAKTLYEVLADFFTKPGIWFALIFVILFRAGEGLVQTIGRIFLLEPMAKGGLGMDTTQMGFAYGTVGTITFIVGSILGGYFAAWLGLRKALVPLILILNLPNLTFWYLSFAMPNPATDMFTICTALGIEMFGFGFGFAGLTLYLMQVVAPGKYPTAHYAIGTALMAQGLNIFTAASGTIKSWMDYQTFFIVGVLAAIPVLTLAFFAKVPDSKES